VHAQNEERNVFLEFFFDFLFRHFFLCLSSFGSDWPFFAFRLCLPVAIVVSMLSLGDPVTEVVGKPVAAVVGLEAVEALGDPVVFTWPALGDPVTEVAGGPVAAVIKISS